MPGTPKNQSRFEWFKVSHFSMKESTGNPEDSLKAKSVSRATYLMKQIDCILWCQKYTVYSLFRLTPSFHGVRDTRTLWGKFWHSGFVFELHERKGIHCVLRIPSEEPASVHCCITEEGCRREAWWPWRYENLCEGPFGSLFLGSVVQVLPKFLHFPWKYAQESDLSFLGKDYSGA